MKRALIFLVVLLIALVAVRKTTVVSEFSSSSANNLMELTPVKAQTVVTSLPPLTNLSFRAQRPPPKSDPNPPPQPETQDSSSANEQPKEPSTAIATTTTAANPNRRDPLARVALSLVGVDPAAEEYWISAINDPSLSAQEREDLIEDLNEEGFADPKNPTPDELPLVISRLQLIEEYAPFAMDDTNARSFAEAYKDLANMFARLTAR